MTLTDLIKKTLISLAAVAAFTACDSAIYDEEGDCSVTYRVKLTYTKNMKGADAFPVEVTHVALYAFDPDGNLATAVTKTAEELHAADNYVNLDLEPGRYDIVAWCGGTSREPDAARWTLAGGDTPVAKTDLLCTLSTTPGEAAGKVVSDKDLHRLYHGSLADAEMPALYGTHDYTIDLTKDTNFIRVILQHADGDPVNPEWFTFSITDTNTALDHTNTPASADVVTYRPWAVTSVATEMPDPDHIAGSKAPARQSRTVTSISSVIAEMTTSRLVTTSRPVIEVHCTEPGNEHSVARLDLISYLLMIKGSANRHMTDQEFLDCQDDYSMMLILDDNNRWNISLGLYINSWRIVRQETVIQ